MKRDNAYNAELEKHGILDKYNTIEKKLIKYHDLDYSYNNGYGFCFIKPIIIGKVGEHNMYLTSIELGSYNFDNEILFNFGWEQVDINQYPPYVIDEYDHFYLKNNFFTTALTKNDDMWMEDAKDEHYNISFVFNENMFDDIIKAINKKENIKITENINELYKLSKLHLEDYNKYMVGRILEYYVDRYYKYTDYTLSKSQWNKVKDWTEDDYLTYNAKPTYTKIDLKDILSRTQL